MSNRDSVRRFLFNNTNIRGERVILDSSFEQALASHDYPEPVRKLLGELVAATVLLSTTLKYKGLMTIQAKGTGPLSLLMVECTDQQTFRALARVSGDCSQSGLSNLLGQGQMVMTIDPDQGKRYQGIVPLNDETLSQSLEHYFAQSEQLPTRVWLASDGMKASGLFIQSLPDNKDNGAYDKGETWNRITTLSNTVSGNELLTLDSERLLGRLYHEEDVRVFDAESVSFKCNCSLQRSAHIIRGIGQEEAESVVRDEGKIAMDCQFCNKQYTFSAEDVAKIFSGHDLKIF
ncbi:Hsp33 family molecular chaperone HslO [Candidatus Sororendozoicomonas aggregata]|uniref:Hsp33 family molecular chaperone HslO n=1 Tax=Candidatus Sororendozoicomonas aggregata TaxID=3073239 RepID=UPI002ED55044